MAVRRTKLKSRSLERGASAPLIASAIGKGDAAAAAVAIDPLKAAQKIGHEFKRRTFYKPTYCQHCSEMLWGIMNQGYQCSVCNFVSHERCLPYLMTDCLHLLSEHIQNPVEHTWIGPKASKKKKKWCNVCRKKIAGPAMFCQVCRYYSHEQCVEHALNNCKECASFTSAADIPMSHHWIEGNLSSSAKCEVCSKCCYTDLCLTGFRCGWCGLTLHSQCLDNYTLVPKHQQCSFRDLTYMMLPPNCVSMSISRSNMLQREEETLDDDQVPQLFTNYTEDEDVSSNKGRPVIVIDGREFNKKWRKRTLHPIHVDSRMSAGELLRVSLRKCSVPLATDEFFLAEASSEGERRIGRDEIIYNLPQAYRGPLKLYIRKQEAVDRTHQLRVFNSKLSSLTPFVNVIIKEHFTAADIVREALVTFEMEEEDPANYCLYEINQTSGVTERTLPDDEKPWKQIQKLSKDSLRSVSLLRHYLHYKEKVSCAFYLWKVRGDHLENSSTAMEYLERYIASSSLTSDDLQIGPIFPQLGAFFVNVQSIAVAEVFYNSLSQANCNIKVVPTICEEKLNPTQEPTLLFINGRSGGNQGIELINGFSRHLNPHQIYDLSQGGPLPGLYSFRGLSKYRVLVGGGDGTFGWVLSALDMMAEHLKLAFPPCALLPLGTGNDLARALNWGGGYTGSETIMQILYSIEDADTKLFDRWNLEFKEDTQLLTELCSESPSPVQSKTVTMNNYFGIGLDAEIALGFHQAREDHPEKFNSRLHNKSVYLQLGVQKTLSRDSTAELHTQVTIKVDDKLILLPTGLKGIVLLNIASWGAGSEPWGSHVDDNFKKNSFDDGLLEVMGISGPMHMGQIKGGMRNGIRIAQGKDIIITLSATIPVQVDGEAWNQPPCMIQVSRFKDQANMLCKSSRPFYQRGLSHRQARSLLDKNPNIHSTEGLSMRKENLAGIPELKKGASAQTIYLRSPTD